MCAWVLLLVSTNSAVIYTEFRKIISNPEAGQSHASSTGAVSVLTNWAGGIWPGPETRPHLSGNMAGGLTMELALGLTCSAFQILLYLLWAHYPLFSIFLFMYVVVLLFIISIFL